MVPFVVLVLVVAVLWALCRPRGAQTPADLCAVLRVRDGADTLEALLRDAQGAGMARVIVVDEGSSDLTWQIAHAFARTRPWVEVCHGLDMARLPVATLVLDAREPQTARHAARLLQWLASTGAVGPGHGADG